MATRTRYFCVYLLITHTLTFSPSAPACSRHCPLTTEPGVLWLEVGCENRPGAGLPEASDLVGYIHLNSGNVLNSLQRCLKLKCKRWYSFSAGTFILPWYFLPGISFPIPLPNYPSDRSETDGAILLKQL